MYPIAEFVAGLEGVPCIQDPAEVRLRSRDGFAVSPLLRKALAGKAADVVVVPRDRAELLRTVRAAVQHRVPLIPRGGGTANYGQSVPLQGGALLDLRELSGMIWCRPGALRCHSGTRMDRLDEEARATGWELRIHPSTRKSSTVAGFIAGGSGGMGSCAWGMLADRGNITALQLLSMEAEPRTVELRGEAVVLAQHAYGTNGIITEVELPLAPAWPWRELVLGFPDYGRALRFGVQLGRELGILKKLISIHEGPAPAMMRALGGLVPPDRSAVFTMVAESSRPAFDDLLAEHGGEVLADHAEGQGPYGGPLYEFAYGHGLRQIQKSHPRTAVLQGMFPADRLVETLERVRDRLHDAGPMRTEIFFSRGELVGMGSPYVTFESVAQMAALVRAMQEEGASIANSHTTGLSGVGIKALAARDREFRRAMDPHGLLNPGQAESAAPVLESPCPPPAGPGCGRAERAMDLHEAVHAQLRRCNVTLAATLPDDWVAPLIRRIDADPAIRHVPVAREAEAVAICSGAFFGGVNSVAVMGATGLLTCTGELATLNLRHAIPVFCIVSLRGSIDDHRVYQEVQGRRTLDVLRTYDFPFHILERPEQVAEIPDAYHAGRLQKRPFFLFLSRKLVKGSAAA
ncbi:FAD-binding protein [Roseomonas sp. BN140053]|uniref:FAD-binding protein n=1 Tax=Roseomonas sp. BN140053 TaxID=3391898 RepID=UPI0039EA4C12